MKAKKYVITLLFIFLLISGTILICSVKDNMYSKKLLIDFFELIEDENIDDISLKIYYMSPYILTIHPLSVDDLTSKYSDQKIVINGNDLEEHIDLFKQISNDNLIPVKKKSYLDARLYYVLESRKSGKLFEVAMWNGDNESIFVNGVEVYENDIFYYVIKPFLPEDVVKELNHFRAGT